LDNFLQNIGNVVIAITMAALTFTLLFLDKWEKNIVRRIDLISGKDPYVTGILKAKLDRVELYRWILCIVAGSFFVIGAGLLILGIVTDSG
jgi:hypothetical protein